LAKERDAIWAAAVSAYKSGEQWWLDYEDEIEAETIAEEFQTSDPWLMRSSVSRNIGNRYF
jgi:predicted P-loop ATPase